MSQIECKNLAVGYEGKAVVENLNFSIQAGDYLCIIGENGAGKSTLMKTLLHLQPLIEGSIQLGDGLSANDIGYLPQQTPIQKDFPASVKEIVLSGCQNQPGFHPFCTQTDKERALQAMEKLSIDTLAHKSYRELSGGQQQRVLLARALCATKKLLVLDEPVSGLDPASASDMYQMISKLNEKENLTILMISHDLSESIRYSSHVLYMGTPGFYGTKEAYLADDSQLFFRNHMDGRPYERND